MAVYAVPKGPRREAISGMRIDGASPTTAALRANGDGGFDVVADGAVLGTIGADRELRQIADAGLEPEVAVVDGAVALPEPGQVLPVNVPPRAPWVLLPEAAVYGAALDEPVDVDTPAQLLFTCDGAALNLDGDPVGELGAQACEALAPTLERLRQRGLEAVVRGFIDASGDLTVSAGPLPAGALPAVSPLPALVRDLSEEDDVARPDTGFFATADAEAAALAADTEEFPGAAEPASRGRGRGTLVAAAAAGAALLLAGVGAVVITSPSGVDRDSASAYIGTVTNSVGGSATGSTTAAPETAAATVTATPSAEAHDTPTESPSSAEFSTDLPAAPVQQAPVQQDPAPAPVQQGPVQEAPAPAPVQQAPVQQAPAPAPAPAPAQPADPRPYEYSIGGLQVRSNTRLDQPLYEVAEP